MKLKIAFALLLLATPVHAAEMAISQGVFHGGNHEPADTASGAVSLVKLEDGSFELRLGGDFSTTPGPDLVVYLSAAADPRADAEIKDAAFLDAGALTSPTGSQAYRLPKEFDPAKFNSIAIWCKSYGVLFGAAALATP